MAHQVTKVESDRYFYVKDAWDFHGISGTRVKAVGLIPANRGSRKKSHAEFSALLDGRSVTLAEKWYVQGRTLNAVVLLDDKPLWEHFPDRRTYFIEPTRRFDPHDTASLVRVSGGLPPMWKNPIAKDEEDPEVPYFGDVVCHTKWWLPDHKKNQRLIESLYTHPRGNKKRDAMRDTAEAKFDTFFQSQGPAAMFVFGDCGIGKTWFVVHVVTHHRPKNSDFVYIDLRGRPRGAELATMIERELGTFLDQTVNMKLEGLTGLYHYLIPIVRPLFSEEEFDLTDKRVRDEMDAVYRRIAYDPARLVEYNDIRLGYYDNAGKTLYVVVDNVDNYDPDEQATVVETVTRYLFGHPRVKVIIPVRPTSRLLMERLSQSLDFIPKGFELHSPDLKEMLLRRLSVNHLGGRLNVDSTIPQSSLTWRQLLQIYIGSAGASLLMDLSTSESDIPPPTFVYRNNVVRNDFDSRHYIRLFRRLLFSDVLMKFENIRSEYYALHALLLRAGESFSEQSAFLYNLFDNDAKEVQGNALVRYRVLEYFHRSTDIGPLFDAFFRALGPGPRVARKVMRSFIRAGLLIPCYVVDGDKEVLKSARISNAGRRHFAVVRNLWYGICVKTGMYVEPDMIMRGDDAREAAKEFVESERVLDFYADYGWVKDEDFIKFLWKQVDLEDRRVGDFERENPEYRLQIAGLMAEKSNPGDVLNIEYGHQIHTWTRRRSRLVTKG